MSDAIIERNRRAVYHALAQGFEDPATQLRALEVWERKFSEQRGFRVNLYVNEVAQELGLNDNQVRALASFLYAAMTTPERNLPQLPSSMRINTPAKATIKPVPPPPPPTDVSLQTGVHNPRLAVFATLLAALTDNVTRAQKFNDFLEALDSQNPTLSPACARARTVWINGGLTGLRKFADAVPDRERRAVVNDLYVALCDACGPVIADRMLAAAIRTTEQSAEAPFCSPREFL